MAPAYIRCFDALRNDYGGFPALMEPIDETVLPYLRSYSYDASMSDMGVDFIYNNDQFIQGKLNLIRFIW